MAKWANIVDAFFASDVSFCFKVYFVEVKKMQSKNPFYLSKKNELGYTPQTGVT